MNDLSIYVESRKMGEAAIKDFHFPEAVEAVEIVPHHGQLFIEMKLNTYSKSMEQWLIRKRAAHEVGDWTVELDVPCASYQRASSMLVEEKIMKITNVTDFEVTIEDENRNISHVHQQSDKKWRCQRCDRLRCEHVRFVQQSGVQLLPRQPLPPSNEEILTY